MRFEGKLKSWNDDRGFEFIESIQGSQEMFVHVKASKPRAGRSQIDQVFSFEMADVRGCVLLVAPVDPVLRVDANRDLLLGSLGNLLSNAFKFTHRHSAVNLIAYEVDDRLIIDVEDKCGGLATNAAETMFAPFTQLDSDRTGLGLGLALARQNVESMGGTLTVKNLPEVGCIFTIGFPNSTVERRSDFGALR